MMNQSWRLRHGDGARPGSRFLKKNQRMERNKNKKRENEEWNVSGSQPAFWPDFRLRDTHRHRGNEEWNVSGKPVSLLGQISSSEIHIVRPPGSSAPPRFLAPRYTSLGSFHLNSICIPFIFLNMDLEYPRRASRARISCALPLDSFYIPQYGSG